MPPRPENANNLQSKTKIHHSNHPKSCSSWFAKTPMIKSRVCAPEWRYGPGTGYCKPRLPQRNQRQRYRGSGHRDRYFRRPCLRSASPNHDPNTPSTAEDSISVTVCRRVSTIPYQPIREVDSGGHGNERNPHNASDRVGSFRSGNDHRDDQSSEEGSDGSAYDADKKAYR